MPAISAAAPGKIILFGEHAVVYGKPAIAAPVSEVRARALVMAAPLRPAGEVLVQAPDLKFEEYLEKLPDDHPLGLAITLVLSALELEKPPACVVRVSSTIPIAAGLGSGAAVSIALIRAFSAFLGRVLPDATVSNLAFEVDNLYHGTPSGIDNTVITYALPVYFVRGQLIEILELPDSFTIVIGDTGIQSPTSVAVGELRRHWQLQQKAYNRLFDDAAEIAREARRWIEAGQPDKLGPLMDKNHELLCQMGVSSPELNRLVEAAIKAGALGAKLSGGGRGGNMIALVREEDAPAIAKVLLSNGAVSTITTTIRPPGSN
jgi:mevalonate kinase